MIGKARESPYVWVAELKTEKETPVARSKSTRRGPLPSIQVRPDDPHLTRFAGLAPLLQFCTDQLQLTPAMARIVGNTSKRTHPVHLVLIAFLMANLAGVHRLRHIEELHDDALLNKLSRLKHWPVKKVFSRALAQLSEPAITKLIDLIATIGLTDIPHMTSAILDGDTTPLVCYGTQEGAQFGYCGKLGRNRRRHFPLVASLAANRAVVSAKYRDGSSPKAEEVRDFLIDARERLAKHVPDVPVMMRLDSGFYSKLLTTWMLTEDIHFAIAFPLQAHLKKTLANGPFSTIDEDIDIAILNGEYLHLDQRLRVVVIRRVVHDPQAPPPGKTIASHPRYRYQAILSSLDWDGVDIWRFYNDRGDCERIFKVGRQSLGLGCLVGQSFRANESAFLLRLLAFNLDRLFASHCASEAADIAIVPVREGLMSRQRRYYRSLGRLVEHGHQLILRISPSRLARCRWAFYAPHILRPA